MSAFSVESAAHFNTRYITSQATLVRHSKEWVAGGKSSWWKAFTDLKHKRMSKVPTRRNVILALAVVLIILTLRNEAEFKAGSVSLELYDLFFQPTRFCRSWQGF